MKLDKTLTFSTQDPVIENYIANQFGADTYQSDTGIIPSQNLTSHNSALRDGAWNNDTSRKEYPESEDEEVGSTAPTEDNPVLVENPLLAQEETHNLTEHEGDSHGAQTALPIRDNSSDREIPSIQETALYLLQHRYSRKEGICDKAYIAFLKILDRPDIPLSVFNDVSKWALGYQKEI